MNERQLFHKAVREMRLELGAVPAGAFEPPRSCVMLTSIENRSSGLKGGVAMQVGKRCAAELIVKGTHRLSTPEEIEAYDADQVDRRRAARDADNLAARRIVVTQTERKNGQ